MLLALSWTTVIGLAAVYTIGTLFGYFVALRRGRKEGINFSVDNLISNGYIRHSINDKGEVVLYKYWEDVVPKQSKEQL